MPYKHLRGQGCIKCSGRIKSNTIDFINKSNLIHNHKYDYSNVEYINSDSKVRIRCSIHGEFYQAPIKHLRNQGCRRCGRHLLGNRLRKLQEDFIHQANIAHNNKYNYEQCHYIASDIKVNIICNTHGMFNQIANNHLAGNGCPKCASSISKLEIKWLDLLSIPIEYRQKTIKINNKNYRVDAYDPINNTIYEFYGDFWHGNPVKYNSDTINLINKKTHGELYKATKDRENVFSFAGYNLITMWENNFNK